MRTRPLLSIGLISTISAFALVLVPQSIAEAPSLTSSMEMTAEKSAAPSKAKKTVVSSVQKRKTLAYVGNVTQGTDLLPIANQPAIKENQRILADKVLRALPSGCRDNLKNFYVRYDNPKNRGLGGKTTIILDGNVSDTEFMALLTHECGHVIHSNMLGTSAGGSTAYKDGSSPIYGNSPLVSFFSAAWENENVLRENVDATDFVSGYAKSDMFENFSEAFTLYMLHPQAMEQQAQDSAVIASELAWMKAIFPQSQPLSISSYSWNGKAPWDVTKLPYKWTAN